MLEIVPLAQVLGKYIPLRRRVTVEDVKWSFYTKFAVLAGAGRRPQVSGVGTYCDSKPVNKTSQYKSSRNNLLAYCAKSKPPRPSKQNPDTCTFVAGESQRGIDARIPKRTKYLICIRERTYFNCKMRMTLFELLFVMVQRALAGVPWSTRGSRCGYPLCSAKTVLIQAFRRCISRLANRIWCLW